MSSLFKDVQPDGSVSYSDTNRFVCIDNITNATYRSGLIDSVVGDLYPITMPYMPTDKPYKVYCEDYLTNPKNGDYDTVGILYCIEPDGTRKDIYRYFKDAPIGFDEIDEQEYEARKVMDKRRKLND